LETCGECPDFPCAKFKSVEEYRAAEVSAYAPARKMLPNLHFIRKHGVASFVRQQMRRMRVLQTMFDFDDGRSRSFYCRAAALLEPQGAKEALREAQREIRRLPSQDAKARARILRSLLNQHAASEGIEW
jgi:hypothetical protein